MMSDTATNPTTSQRSAEMVNKIRELFPEWAVFFDDGGGEFGDDVRDLLIRAVEQGYTIERFRREFAQTEYAKNVSQAVDLWNRKTDGQRRDETATMVANIRAGFGDAFSFEGGEAILEQVGTQAARQGLSGNRLKNFVYAEVLRLGPKKTPEAVAQTVDAETIKNQLREYGYTPSNDELTSVLTGTADRKGVVLNQDALIARARNVAKGNYPQLTEQLDSGLSLDDIFKNYRSYASRILELDESQIDFVNDPKWSAAFGTKETGPMSLSQWVTELRSNDDYGWQFTQNARDKATNLVMQMEKAFGFRR